MTALIATGLSGTLGSHLGSRWRSAGIRLDGSPSNWKIPGLGGSKFIHLAAAVPTADKYSPKLCRLINVENTVALAQLARDEGASAFLFVSSSHVYGANQTERIQALETDNCLPASEYGRQKLEAENELRRIFTGSPTRLVIARVFSVLDWGTANRTLGARVMQLCLQSDQVDKLDFASDVRDFLTPKQAADLLQELILGDADGTYNVSTGFGMTVGDAAIELANQHGYDLTHRVIARNSASPFIVGNNEKLLGTLGLDLLRWTYAPRV